MKTLVVEDELTSRLLIQGILARFGECHVAINGKEGVEAFRLALKNAAPYDLICMDIQLPKMNGVEAVRRIRELETADGVLSTNGVKIMMTTAMDEPREVVQSFDALCDGYFVKPILAAELLDELRKLNLID